jgi:hypothetical protein
VNWVPGNTLHYVRNDFGRSRAVNVISAQASGIELRESYHDSNLNLARFIQAPYFGTGGSAGIYLSGHNYITINGGNTGNATARKATFLDRWRPDPELCQRFFRR